MPILKGKSNEQLKPNPRRVKAMERYLAAHGMTMKQWLALDEPKR